MEPKWLMGTVKTVPTGDTLDIRGNYQNGPPPERRIMLARIQAPKLGTNLEMDEPFAWESREFLRKKCAGKEVAFKVDSWSPFRNKEIGAVELNTLDIAFDVIRDGWAKVRPPRYRGKYKVVDPVREALKQLEDRAKRNGLGIWNKKPEAQEAAIRRLPPSAVGDPISFDFIGFFDANKGRALPAIVEHVRDGNTVQVYFLPGFQHVRIFLAGIKAPNMRRRAASEEPYSGHNEALNESGGDSKLSEEPLATNMAATRIEDAPEPFAHEAKHFTEVEVLNRDVRITLNGVQEARSLRGSVHYEKGSLMVDLALELVRNGLARLLIWSVNLMDEEPRRVLQDAESQAKKDRIGLWYNNVHISGPSNSIAIVDQHFSGKVTEIVTGDCIMVLENAASSRNPQVEREVYLSSIRAPRSRVGKGRNDERLADYGHHAKEFLRTRLIGQQVHVTMEYKCEVLRLESDSHWMDFGSVHFVPSFMRDFPEFKTIYRSLGINVAELLLFRGLATAVNHGEFQERSQFYDELLAAQSHAVRSKRGLNSGQANPAFPPSTWRMPPQAVFSLLPNSGRLNAIVERVFNAEHFKLLIDRQAGGVIYFSLSGIHCPARGQPFFEEALTFVRQKIMQRDVQIEVHTFWKSGAFGGNLWQEELNVSIALLKAGLAKLNPGFNPDRATEGQLMVDSERLAKQQHLKVWDV